MALYNEVVSPAEGQATVNDVASLPSVSLPVEIPEMGFLYEWFVVFWDLYRAQCEGGANKDLATFFDVSFCFS